MKNLAKPRTFFLIFIMLFLKIDFLKAQFVSHTALPNRGAIFIFEEFKSFPIDTVRSSINMGNIKGSISVYDLPDTLNIHTNHTPDTLGTIIITYDKAYYRNYGDTGSYRLLYDYTLNIGDTAYYDSLIQDYAIITDTSAYWATNNSGLLTTLRALKLSNGDEWIQCQGSLRHPYRPIATQSLDNYNVCYISLEYVDSTNSVGLYVEAPSGCSKPISTLEEEINNNINIYPNPIKNNNLIIQTNESIFVKHVSIYDLSGKQVFAQNINSLENNLNLTLPNLPNGMYIVQIDTEKGLVNKKINVLK